MEKEAMISEILRRVQDKLAALEQSEAADKPRLLVLAQDHGSICHPTYESAELREYYHMDCVLLDEKRDIADYEGVIAYTLTNDALGKIASGICDTEYTRAFGASLLLGKRIFVPEEEVELYRYRDTAQNDYYERLNRHMDFLKRCGVRVVPNERLIQSVLGEEQAEACAEITRDSPETKSVRAMKRVITEQDIVAAQKENATVIQIGDKAILTDLAREYAKRHGITMEREAER